MGKYNDNKIFLSFIAATNFALVETAREEMEKISAISETQQDDVNTSSWDNAILPAALKLVNVDSKKTIKIIKRTLIAIMIIVCVFSSIMIASADVRNAVVKTIIEWTGINIGFRFEIEGEPLKSLPAGYKEHYVPNGFSYRPDMSVDRDLNFIHTYKDAKNKQVIINVRVIENASETWVDNEYTTYDKISFNGVTAYLGEFTDITGLSGYRIIWAKGGIEHLVEAYTNLSELFKIIESIK